MNNDELLKELQEEASYQLKKMHGYEPGTKEYAAALMAVEKLSRQIAEKEKIQKDRDDLLLNEDKFCFERDKFEEEKKRREREAELEQEKIDLEKEKFGHQARMDNINGARADLHEDHEMEKMKLDYERLRFEKDQSEKDILMAIIRTGVNVAEIVLPMGFFGYWFGKSFVFEEEGILKSDTFKWLKNMYKPKFKI